MRFRTGLTIVIVVLFAALIWHFRRTPGIETLRSMESKMATDSPERIAHGKVVQIADAAEKAGYNWQYSPFPDGRFVDLTVYRGEKMPPYYIVHLPYDASPVLMRRLHEFDEISKKPGDRSTLAESVEVRTPEELVTGKDPTPEEIVRYLLAEAEKAKK